MKYLVVKTSSLGDILQTFPVIDYLKQRDPHSQVDWVVEGEYASLLRAHPGVQSVVEISSRDWRKVLRDGSARQRLKASLSSLRQTVYDVVFDLQGNTKSALVTFLARASHKVGFGWASRREWPNYCVLSHRFNVDPRLSIQRHYLSVVQQFFQDPHPFLLRPVLLQPSPADEAAWATWSSKIQEVGEGRRRMMVAFGSRWKNKTLSLALWKQFLQALAAEENCSFYVVTQTFEQRKWTEELLEPFPGSIEIHAPSFAVWQRMMQEMDLVLAVDSAALALCGTTSTPSLGIFGPTQSAIYLPEGTHHTAYQGACPYGVVFDRRCPYLRTCPTGACLQEAELSALMAAYRRVGRVPSSSPENKAWGLKLLKEGNFVKR